MKKLLVFIGLLLSILTVNSQTTNLRARNLNNVKYADQFAGSDASIKITASFADLPSTGGVVYAIFTANQAWSTCPFTGVTKQTTLYLASVHVLAVNCTIPSNINIQFQQNGQISVNSGKVLTIQGTVDGSKNQHFAGVGLVSFSSSGQAQVYPEWWGAIPDGVTNSGSAIQSAVDSIISGANLNTIQNAPSGTVKFGNGVYLQGSTTISTCHFNNCPGGGSVPAGTINACVNLEGTERGSSVLFTTSSIDQIQMYSWSCPSKIKDLYIVSSGISVGIHVKGNQTDITHNWFLSDTGIKIESTATIDTTGTRVTDNQFDAVQVGGGPGSIVVTRSAGALLSPNNLHFSNNHHFGGAYSYTIDHIWDSHIENETHSGPGTFGISISNGTRVTIDHYSAVGGNVNNDPNEDCLRIANSTGITVTSLICSAFPGPALNIQNSNVFIGPFSFSDNVQNGSTAFPYEVYLSSSDVVLMNGKISNSAGNPTNAIFLTGSGPAGSYDISGIKINGSKFTGKVIDSAAGAGGMYRISLTNNELRAVNTTGGATPTINIAATLSLFLMGNRISHAGAPTNWLVSSFASAQTCIYGNSSDAGAVSLNSVSFVNGTNGCFSGAAQLTRMELASANITGQTTVSSLLINGGTAAPPAGFISMGYTTVGALPAAGSSPGFMIFVTDSTSIGAEGQACVGGSGTKALAFSNAGIWKCF